MNDAKKQIEKSKDKLQLVIVKNRHSKRWTRDEAGQCLAEAPRHTVPHRTSGSGDF